MDKLKKEQRKWKEFLVRVEEHAKCPVHQQCRGCGKTFCKHLDGCVLLMDSLCHHCDTHCQPYMANPINKEYCKQYFTTEQYEAVWPPEEDVYK